MGAQGSVLKSVVKLSGDHLKRFGEPLDVDEFDEFLVKQREANPHIDVATAYSQFIAPRVSEKQKVEFDQKLKEAREEGRKEAMSQHHLPVDSGSKEFSAVFDPKFSEIAKMSPEQQEHAAREEFFKGWQEAVSQ